MSLTLRRSWATPKRASACTRCRNARSVVPTRYVCYHDDDSELAEWPLGRCSVVVARISPTLVRGSRSLRLELPAEARRPLAVARGIHGHGDSAEASLCSLPPPKGARGPRHFRGWPRCVGRQRHYSDPMATQ